MNSDEELLDLKIQIEKLRMAMRLAKTPGVKAWFEQRVKEYEALTRELEQ